MSWDFGWCLEIKIGNLKYFWPLLCTYSLPPSSGRPEFPYGQMWGWLCMLNAKTHVPLIPSDTCTEATATDSGFYINLIFLNNMWITWFPLEFMIFPFPAK